MRQMLLIAVMLMMFGASGWVRADAIDEAEAKRRGVTVNYIILERRVKQLEQVNQDLTRKLAALEKPAISSEENDSTGATTMMTEEATTKADAAVTTLVAILRKMPQDYWPTDGDTEAKIVSRKVLREEWIAANVIGKKVLIPIKVINMSVNDKVVGESTHNAFWGKIIKLAVFGVPTAEEKDDFKNLKRGEEVDITGHVISCVLLPPLFNTTHISLNEATLKKDSSSAVKPTLKTKTLPNAKKSSPKD